MTSCVGVEHHGSGDVSGGASLFHDGQLAQKEDRTKDCVYPSKTHLCDYFLQLGHFSSETAQQGTKHLRYEPVGDTTCSHHGRISSPDLIYGSQIFFPRLVVFPLSLALPLLCRNFLLLVTFCGVAYIGDRECMGPCVC